jgi:hypothetical protein
MYFDKGFSKIDYDSSRIYQKHPLSLLYHKSGLIVKLSTTYPHDAG